MALNEFKKQVLRVFLNDADVDGTELDPADNLALDQAEQFGWSVEETAGYMYRCRGWMSDRTQDDE